MTTAELLSRLEGVRSRGTGKWSARCPAHQDNSPSLAIAEGDRCILIHCFALCSKPDIVAAVGLTIKDLFFDGLPDPRQRREALQRRAKELAAQRAADKTRGRKTDLLKQAEHLVQSARSMTIDTWTPAQLDKRLNRLADAYDVLWEERHD